MPTNCNTRNIITSCDVTTVVISLVQSLSSGPIPQCPHGKYLKRNCLLVRECLPSFPAVSGSAAFLFVQAAVRTAGPGLVISPLSSSQYRHSKREIQKCINNAIQFLIYYRLCKYHFFIMGRWSLFLPEIIHFTS